MAEYARRLTFLQILVGKSASLALAEAIGNDNVVISDSLVNEAKSIKNEVEQEGFRQCHIVRQFAVYLKQQTIDEACSVMVLRWSSISPGSKNSSKAGLELPRAKVPTSWSSIARTAFINLSKPTSNGLTISADSKTSSVACRSPQSARPVPTLLSSTIRQIQKTVLSSTSTRVSQTSTFRCSCG